MNKGIVILRDEERVRKRPAVIFGDDGKMGCLKAVSMIIENAAIEAKAGYGYTVTVKRFADGSYEITDCGRGIPVEFNSEENRFNWELNFCELYTGSKFGNRTGEYNYSLGLEGMGLCAVQYASEYMDAQIYRNGKSYALHFEKGRNKGGMKSEEILRRKTGTCLRFRPDREVFRDVDISFEMLCETVRCFAVFAMGTHFRVEFYDSEGCRKKEYFYNGIGDIMREKALVSSCFEAGKDFTGIKKERKISGKIRIGIGLTPGKAVRETYHFGELMMYECSPISALENEIKKKLYEEGYSDRCREIEKIMENISIIVYSEVFPKHMTGWRNGRCNSYENELVDYAANEVGAILSGQLVKDNEALIKQII